jgi:hypothetical protein
MEQSTKLTPLVENNLKIRKRKVAASKESQEGALVVCKRKENVDFQSLSSEPERRLTRNRSRDLMSALVNF